MRKSSKDCRADRASVNSRIQAEADAAIKAPPVMTGSAIDPAFLFVFGSKVQEASCREEGAA
ncbi:hypothetical protein LAD12857_49920 [Lacrimispora amygdalina]|uniref:Uncharacterized protein n=1 Tax=Lacrimispora amygdalina TaxID=253257 RepID=A0ABQ5MDX7_9FIRM